MGYTHYWNRPQIIQPSAFSAIGNDLERLLPALESAGAPLANPYGRELPEIGSESSASTVSRAVDTTRTRMSDCHGRKAMRTVSATTVALPETCRTAPAMAIVPTSRSGSTVVLPETKTMEGWEAFAKPTSDPMTLPSWHFW